MRPSLFEVVGKMENVDGGDKAAEKVDKSLVAEKVDKSLVAEKVDKSLPAAEKVDKSLPAAEKVEVC